MGTERAGSRFYVAVPQSLRAEGHRDRSPVQRDGISSSLSQHRGRIGQIVPEQGAAWRAVVSPAPGRCLLRRCSPAHAGGGVGCEADRVFPAATGEAGPSAESFPQATGSASQTVVSPSRPGGGLEQTFSRSHPRETASARSVFPQPPGASLGRPFSPATTAQPQHDFRTGPDRFSPSTGAASADRFPTATGETASEIVPSHRERVQRVAYIPATGRAPSNRFPQPPGGRPQQIVFPQPPGAASARSFPHTEAAYRRFVFPSHREAAISATRSADRFPSHREQPQQIAFPATGAASADRFLPSHGAAFSKIAYSPSRPEGTQAIASPATGAASADRFPQPRERPQQDRFPSPRRRLTQESGLTNPSVVLQLRVRHSCFSNREFASALDKQCIRCKNNNGSSHPVERNEMIML
ncbi:uncharacterized protein LOC131879619 [Tigriopus californicus]|uniref:uncharacterized protein LOC131879619 n=1 Tax=Tigriopus californicus TaxID=6832 RepID=UPI0027DA39E2|nr:uncharacterized protein LOC131879619 [Tigriopus californicus]